MDNSNSQVDENLSNAALTRKRKQTTPQARPDGNKRPTLLASPSGVSVEYVARLEKELEKLKAVIAAPATYAATSTAVSPHLVDLLVTSARLERETLRRTLQEDTELLGRPVTSATTGATEWSGGKEEEELDKLQMEVEEVRRLLEEYKVKQKTMRKGTHVTSEEDMAYSQHYNREMIQHLDHLLRRKEIETQEKEVRLHTRRILLQKRIRAYRSQEVSLYNDYRRIGRQSSERYILLNMLGKGGFSEVYKAYDLQSGQYVAVKIHELRKDMTEDNKENYVKHVLRECEIQRALKHENIIKFIDAFALNEHCYCHVMEYTEGVDLDTWLKAHGHMNEKEARGILVQIWHALRYMNEGNRRICHYDLKPGNLIYRTDGRIAVLDFGLAKIVQDVGTRPTGDLTFDLTSQGAGTYYYLPPECFMLPETRGVSAVRISNKVDVWSVGCVFFELLFNRKPFGHGKTQESIFRQGLLRDLTSEKIDDIFPKTPKVSKEAKEYIRTLLTVDKARRPDIFAASNDPYLRRPL